MEVLKCTTFGRGSWERKQNKKSYLLYHFISFRDILQEIMNFEYQRDCIIQPPTIRLLNTNLALFLPLPNCSCSRPLAWQKCCCYSGWRTHLRGTLCSTVSNLFSANSSFLLTALPTPEKATDTRAAPALVLAHPSSNSTAPLHHLLLGVLNEHQCLDGTTYSEITQWAAWKMLSAGPISYGVTGATFRGWSPAQTWVSLQLWQSHMSFYCLSSLNTNHT